LELARGYPNLGYWFGELLGKFLQTLTYGYFV